jgi:hypothetical protein
LAAEADTDDIDDPERRSTLRQADQARQDFGPPNAAQCAGHDKGWAHYLGRLAMAAAGRNPGIDRGPHAT